MTDMENKEIPIEVEELEKTALEALENHGLVQVETKNGKIIVGKITEIEHEIGKYEFGPGGLNQIKIYIRPKRDGGQKEEIIGDINEIDRSIERKFIKISVGGGRMPIVSLDWVRNLKRIPPIGVEMTFPSKEIKIGYKVVSAVNGKSFGPVDPASLQRIRYRIGKWTEQNPYEYGPFSVFQTLEDAKKWLEGMIYWNRPPILEVEYTSALDSKGDPFRYLWKKSPPTFTGRRWGGGYYAEAGDIEFLFLGKCPKGTDLAFSLRPLRVVR